MSPALLRKIGFFLVPLLFVAALGAVVFGGLWPFTKANVGSQPTQLASVSVPVQPNSLAWSADGCYLAAGTWGSSVGATVAFEVYVIDVAKASIVATLQPAGAVEGLAFSPDGKWLAVATRPSPLAVAPPNSPPAELVVFSVPAFTASFTAQVSTPENGFIELAWAADSKSLCAIDGPINNATAQAAIRRWDIPGFTEQPVVRTMELQGDAGLAMSPAGQTVALSFGAGIAKTSLVQLFEPGQEPKHSLRSGDPFWPPRVGFTADGKSVGIFDTKQMLWWDVATGDKVEPRGARFAVQPAGLSDFRSRATASPDGAWVAQGFERHPGIGHLSWNADNKEFGGFITMNRTATGQSFHWRVSRAQYPVSVAFSPDGKSLAGTANAPLMPGSKPGSNTGLILIWAVPK